MKKIFAIICVGLLCTSVFGADVEAVRTRTGFDTLYAIGKSVSALAEGGTLTNTLTVTGAVTFSDDLTVVGDLSAGTLIGLATNAVTDTLTVNSNATIGTTLAVTGVGTFTAQSVHNLGIDADFITTDAGKGIDTKAAGELVVGAATATSLSLGASDIDTTVLGPLNVLEATGKGIDTTGAGALFLGEAVATSVSIGASDIDTTILGPLNVLEATGKGIDTTGAGALFLGEAVATSVSIGASDIDTTILGPLEVLEATGKGIDTTGAGGLFLGQANATSVVLGANDANTTVVGDLIVTGLDIDSAAGSMTIGKATATLLVLGASDIDTTILGPLNVLAATTKGIDTSGAGALHLGEAVATSVVVGATDAPTSIAGALSLKYVLKTGNYTVTADDCIVTYNTSAVTTNTLPDANTVLGRVYIVALQDDDGDLVFNTDGTDKFDGTNDSLTMNDAGDSVTVVATAANVWTIIQISDDNKGTLTTQ